MKIGFQIEHLDPARGGAETYVARFAETLLAAGHEVHLIAAGFGATPPEAYTHRVLQRGLTRWGRDVRFARACAKAARRARLDVTVAVGRTFGANVLQPHGGSVRASRRQNLLRVRPASLRRLKAFFDGFSPRVRTHVGIEDEQYRARPAPEVVAISRMVLRDLQEFHGVPDERLHLVYNGVDVARFRPEACAEVREEARRRLGLAPGETCYLLVAHNFRLKGLRELLDAAARLPAAEPWRIVVVGRGDPRPYLDRADWLGCGGRLVFTGPMDDVVPAYAAADVYVQPTWYDPCSLVVLEALACGRPVITTRFNGASELMEDGREGGVLDSPAETERLTEAMGRLLDPAVRGPAGEAARRTAERVPLERNFREMMAVFGKAAARRHEEGHG